MQEIVVLVCSALQGDASQRATCTARHILANTGKVEILEDIQQRPPQKIV